MVLDRLYFTMRRAKYPIHNRKELVNALGDTRVCFEGNFLTAEEIAVNINHYPIYTIAEFFHHFLKKESKSNDLDEYEMMCNFESEAEFVQ